MHEKGWRGWCNVQRKREGSELPCVHLVVGKTREKKFFERCRFRSEALLRQPASQPTSHVLPTVPPSSFACLLHFALSRGINRSVEGGGGSTSLLSVPMELNLTCILTSSLPVEICVGELQQVTSLLFSLFSFFLSLAENSSLRAIRSRIGFQSFSRSFSLSLSPPSSFLNSVPPIHRIEENLSNSRFGESVARADFSFFSRLFHGAKLGSCFFFFLSLS